MKRLFCAAFTVILCLAALASCQVRTVEARGLLAKLCDVFGSEDGIKKGTVYDADRPLSPERFGMLYTGKYDPPPCFSRIAGYAIRLPSDEYGFEIHVIKCINRSDTSEISHMLYSRIQMLRSAEIREYAPDTYLRYFENATVVTKGRYAFLLATPNNEKCVKIIQTSRLA